METPIDRRRPDRHLVAIRLLRGIAIFALVVSALLWAGPPLLTEMGLLGPTPEERVQIAERALVVARSYGGASLPETQAAEGECAHARALAKAGQPREARKAAEHALELATEAQKQALIRRTDSQQRAEAIYNDLDHQINDLEKLYSAVTPGMEKEQVGQMLSMMKMTRQSAGTVFLAYEQQDWNGVLKGEPNARQVISSTRDALKSAQRP
jgi:hypothetical protein